MVLITEIPCGELDSSIITMPQKEEYMYDLSKQGISRLPLYIINLCQHIKVRLIILSKPHLTRLIAKVINLTFLSF